MNAEHSRWKSGFTIGLLLTVIFSFTVGVADQNSSSFLDMTFNSPNGYALWHTHNASQDRNLEMAIQQDGKILVGGYTNNTNQKDIQVLRYYPNGTLDSGFGKGGWLTYSGAAGKDDYAFGMALDAKNNILVSGREDNGNNADILLLRYTPDGIRDSSFGVNGTVTYRGSGNGTDSGRGLVIQKDGKIVVCGEVNVSSHKELAVLRYTPEGKLDPDFASSGVFTLSNMSGAESYGFAVALDQNEHILVTGSSHEDGTDGIVLVKLDENGLLDSSFGSGGTVVWNGQQGGPDYGNWVSITAEDNILVTGVETDTSGSYDIVLLQYHPDGTLDTTFGTDGAARFGYSGYQYAWGQTRMPDGRIIIAGASLVGTHVTPVLIGFTKDGKLDTSFGSNGVVSFETIGIGRLYAVHGDDKGGLVACGYITEGDTDLGLLLRMNQI